MALILKVQSKYVLSFMLTFISWTAVAADKAELFNRLKDSAVNYQVDGVICEQVAKLEYEIEYPRNRYDIINGIVYAEGSRVIGELDVVIIEKQTSRAVLVGEVKCWKDLNGALIKAHSQRDRFVRTIKSGKRIQMYSDGRQYSANQFKDTQEFVAISQNGGKAKGFDHELENSLEELKELREDLMKCQARNECARPKRK